MPAGYPHSCQCRSCNQIIKQKSRASKISFKAASSFLDGLSKLKSLWTLGLQVWFHKSYMSASKDIRVLQLFHHFNTELHFFWAGWVVDVAPMIISQFIPHTVAHVNVVFNNRSNGSRSSLFCLLLPHQTCLGASWELDVPGGFWNLLYPDYF